MAKSPPKQVLELAGVAIGIISAVLLTFRYVVGALDTPRFIGTWDTWLYFGPNQFFLDYCLHHGEFPLWNPLILCGTPFAANPQSQLLYLPNLLRSVLTVDPSPLRTHVGIALMVLAHVVAGGVGMYSRARYHKLSRAAACAGLCAFLFSWSYVLCMDTLYVWTTTVTWAPWFLLAVFRSIDASERAHAFRSALTAGLLLAMAFLAGYPQLAICIGVAAIAGAFTYSWIEPRDHSSTQPSGLRLRAKRFVLVLVVAYGVGVLGSSGLSIPLAEFAKQTTRAKDANIAPRHERFVEDPTLLKVVSSIVTHGRVVSTIVMPGIGIGAGIAMVFCVALLIRPGRQVITYAVMLYVILDATLGPPFPLSSLLARVSPFALSENRAWFLLPLPIGMLAAQGVDSLGKGVESRARHYLTAVAVAVVGFALIPILGNPNANWLAPHLQNVLPPALLLIALLAALVVRVPRWWRVLFPVLVFAELLSWNWRCIPARHAKQFQPYPGTLDDLGMHPDFWKTNTRNVRPFLVMNVDMYSLQGGITGYDPLVLAGTYKLLTDPESETRYERGVEAKFARMNQRYYLFLKREVWLVRQYVHGRLPDKLSVFPAATTAFLPGKTPENVPEVALADLPASAISESVDRVPIPGSALTVTRGNPGDSHRVVRLDIPAVTLPGEHATLRIRYRASGGGAANASATDTDRAEEGRLVERPFRSTGPEGAWLE